MTWESVPWMVHGGRHSAAIGRQLAYAAIGQTEGVVGINDLKVTAQAVPGSTVRHATGTAIMLNRSPGGSQQSYVGRCYAAESAIPISPTGAGAGRSDLIIARVEDPSFEGWEPVEDPENGPYMFTRVLTGVPPTTESIADLNLALPYPAIALARIDIPPSTGTITNAMIKDLRRVARPQSEPQRFTHGILSSEAQTQSVGSPGHIFPAVTSAWRTTVPEWATQAQILAVWGGIRIPAGNVWGAVWVRIGNTSGSPFVTGQTTTYDAPAGNSNVSRQSITASATVNIPASLRGGTWPATMWAFKSDGAVNISVDGGSSVILDIRYLENAAAA